MIAGPALNNDGDALSGIPIVAYQSTLKATRSGLTGFLMIQRGLDEPREQGVGLGRAGLELRVSLGADIERVHILRQLDELGELAVPGSDRKCAGPPRAGDPCRPRSPHSGGGDAR